MVTLKSLIHSVIRSKYRLDTMPAKIPLVLCLWDSNSWTVSNWRCNSRHEFQRQQTECKRSWKLRCNSSTNWKRCYCQWECNSIELHWGRELSIPVPPFLALYSYHVHHVYLFIKGRGEGCTPHTPYPPCCAIPGLGLKLPLILVVCYELYWYNLTTRRI